MPLAITLRVLVALWLAGQPKTWHGNWSANVGNGEVAFTGAWEAQQSDQPDTLTGTWTLTNRDGETVANGTWAARKDDKVWSGSWQARNAANHLSGGTWRARVSLPPAKQFAEMFEAALADTISGTWRMGTPYSGSWSIRAYPQ